MTGLFALLGIACGLLAAVLFERLPAKWLYDFDGSPPPGLGGKRFPAKAALVPAAIGGALYPLLTLQYGFSLPLAFYCIASLPLFLCVLSDWKFQILPTQLCVVLALLALPAGLSEGAGGLGGMLAGGLLSGGIFFLLGIVGKLVYKKEALGFGDVYFAAALGLYFRFFESLWIFALTLLTASLSFGFLVLRGKLKAGTYVPLGPFIGVGFMLALAFRSQLQSFVQWYLSLL